MHGWMWLLPIALATLVQIEGEPSCPTAAAVDAAIARWSPAPRARRLRLVRDAGALSLTLLDGEGRPLAERRLPANAPCAELATAVALVVTIWDRELDGGPVAPLPEPEVTRPASLRRAALPPPARIRYDVAAAFLVGWEPGAGVALGGTVDASFAPRRSRWGARVGVMALAPQTAAFGAGEIHWSRPALSLGPLLQLQLARARIRLVLHAEALAALLIVGSRGFANSTQQLDFDPGLGAGVLLGARMGIFQPFIEARLAGWLRAQNAQLDGFAGALELPRFDLWVSAGLALGR
jgi:hypothetical protein